MKPSTGSYLQPTMLDKGISSPNVDAARKRTRGYFQVKCYSLDGKGSKAVEVLAEQVAALYPLANKQAFETVSIEDHPQISQAMIDGIFRCIVVSVRYRQEA